MIVLELRSISKRLGSFAISDLSLEVVQGEYFVLLGPSGAGKTILLEIVAGLIRPDGGHIVWRGREISQTPPEKRKFALMYQDYALFGHLNVARNIGYGLASSGVPRREAESRIAAVATQLGIVSLLDRRIESLSGGEQQRVALARALVTRPEIILLDEPLSALDSQCRLQLRKQLKQLQRQTGATWIHVTHDLEEAMTVGDRIGVILQNRLCQVGTPEELFRAPSDYEVSQFLGMHNVFPVQWAREGVCVASGVEIHAGEANPSMSHIWIKPEEIVLSRQTFDSSARNQFACTVTGWEHHGCHLAVRLASGALSLVALITYTSFQHLEVREGAELYATFKSTAIHCF
jgi:molybdate/tungstate transport system ATP-binding protein